MAVNQDKSKWGRGLHLAHLNVCSLLGKNKSDLINTQLADSGMDVFTLSETWLTEAIPNSMVDLPNYTIIRHDRSLGNDRNGVPKKGGGLACYVRKGIKFSETKFQDLNVSSPHLEMQWLLLLLENLRPIVIVNVYRPPQGDYKTCCNNIVEAFNRADFKDNSDIFVMGDFNINLNSPQAPESKELIFSMNSLGLKQHIGEPTRISFRNGQAINSRIDLIFSNSDHIKEAKVLDLNLSDHLTVMVTRKKLVTKKEMTDFRGRSYRNYDREIFQNRLVNANWGDFFEERDVNILWEKMESKILGEIDDMCPVKSFRVSKVREPWITNEAIEAIKDKDRLLQKAKRTGKEEDWVNARRARNMVGRELEILRADYLKQQQDEHKANPKKFWQSISKIIPSKKKSKGDIWLRDKISGEEIEAANVPNYINEFFTNIGPNLARAHKEKWVYHGLTSQESMEDFITDRDEVMKLCKEIKIMKSSGCDMISSRVCKDAFVILVDHLVHIFNCSLNSCVFPDAWKQARVVPLFKGGDQSDVSNYRPVSLLPLPGKLLEKIVHKKVVQFFEGQNFLSVHQGGFRKGHSTTATIADLTDEIFTEVNKGLTTLAAFIDLSKAFDTVNTKILLKKLSKAGIRDNVLNWCKSYLTGRMQCTSANGLKSGFLPVSCGVPQGSVLGPLFFLVYVNDLEFVLNNRNVKLYADDTVLYQTGENCIQAERKLQVSLNLFSQWCSENALSINAKKTKLMAFGSRSKVKKCKNTNVRLKNVRLKLVPSYKYLGFNLDPTLSYKTHIASVIGCVQHKLYMLSKIKRYLNTEVAILLYKSMLLPYLDYADVIFSNANTTELDKLQRLQNRCLRLCLGQQRLYSTDRAHKEAGVNFLQDRRRAHVLNFMYLRKSNRPELLNNREIRTRAQDAPLFDTIIPRCEAYKRSVGFAGSEIWNSLPPATRNIGSFKAFKDCQTKDMTARLNAIVVI